VPFFVAFKLVTGCGSFLLPLLDRALHARAWATPSRCRSSPPAASLMFLFNEGQLDVGREHPEHAGGEFAHSLAFALSILFIGQLYAGVEELRGRRWLAVLLAVTGLCHPVAFINSTRPVSTSCWVARSSRVTPASSPRSTARRCC
jgi:hypothetical protein